MRINEPGWIRITPWDKARRRAIWVKVEDKSISFCAGREGDDVYFKIPLNGKPTLENLINLMDIVNTDIWSKEEKLKKLRDIEGAEWLCQNF